MSVILDALRRAQKAGPTSAPPGGGKDPEKKPSEKKRLIILVVVGVCFIGAVFALLELTKPKTPVVAFNAKTPVQPPVPQAPATHQPVPEVKADQKQAGLPANPEATAKPSQIQQSGEALPGAPAEGKDRKGADGTESPRAMEKSIQTAAARVAAGASAGSKQRRPESAVSDGDPVYIVKKMDEGKILAMYNEALDETGKGNTEGARKLYKAILVERPRDVEVLNNLGVLALNEANGREALFYFLKAVDIKKDYSKGYNNLGIVMLQQGDTVKAQDYFRKAINSNRENVESYVNLAAIMRKERRLQEALELLKRPIDGKAKNPPLYLSYAIINDEIGNQEEARKYYALYLQEGGEGGDRNSVIERLKKLEKDPAHKYR